MSDETPNPQEMAALELYHQLVNLSADHDRGDNALLITLRLPNGRYVGDVWLTRQDVDDLADASVGLAAVRDYQDTAQLPDPDSVDMEQALTALENLANGGEQL